MPIYEYRCEKGHTFEVIQRMIDEPLAECTVCGAPVQRVFHPVAVHFKGSGFYNTDYGKKKAAAAAGSDSPKGSLEKESSSASASSNSDSAKSDSSASSSSSSSKSAPTEPYFSRAAKNFLVRRPPRPRRPHGRRRGTSGR